MAIPLLVSAALTLGPELMKIGSGIIQKIKAKKLSKGLKRPDYKVPASIREAVSNARIAAINPEFAGQQQIESKLSADTSSAIDRITEASSSGTEILNTISGLQGKETEARRDIGIAAEQSQVQDVSNLNQALAGQARFEDKASDLEMEEFKRKASAISALKGAGAKNIFSGLGGIGKGALMLGGGGLPGTEGVETGGLTTTGDAVGQEEGMAAFRNAFPGKSDEELNQMITQIGLLGK